MRNEVSRELRRNLFEKIDPESHFNRLFDYLPGIHFFAKDRDGHILYANAELAKLYGYDSEEEFIGRTDFDILPHRMAEKFRIDDINVMEHGRPLLGMVELFLSPQGIPEWYLTNKLPLWSREGQVVGLMGSIQENREAIGQEQPVLDVDKAVSHLRKNFMNDTPVSDLAELCGLSRRQFEEKFKLAYNTSPHQFRIRLRVTAACQLLRETRASVSSIAMQTGFYDQSALSHQVKTIMGYTPLQYRTRFSKNTYSPS